MDTTVADSLWVLLSAFLVFLMHAGFALVESGFSRRKNAVMVLLKNVSVVALASVLYFLVGFAFMFGDGTPWIGFRGFAPSGAETLTAVPSSLPLYVFFFFQLVFAATAATIVSGAVAERSRLGTFLVFTAICSAVIYPVVGHWVWGGGFLSQWGFHDFAGSTVVHAVGGAMALAGAMVVGPRLGKYTKEGGVRPLPAHNFPLAALGVLVLWVGWFGFNGGSTLSADPTVIGPIIVVTNLAASAGFLAALIHTKLRTKLLDLSMALNGALAGLVSITAGCDVIGPVPSLLVGAVAGVIVVEGVMLLDRLRIDDPVGAIPVHLFCGVYGTLAVGLFATRDGLFTGGGAALLLTQLQSVVVAVTFAFLSSFSVWWLMKTVVPGGVRVSRQHEIEGLDISECGVEAYGSDYGGFGPSEEPMFAHEAATALRTARTGA